MSAPRSTMSGICKRFGPTLALAGVDLELHAGEIHALIGENGAGKSTLMKILGGAERPDAGTMTLDGRRYSPADPLAARRSGTAMVHQELMLAPDLSVEANVLLGVEPTRWGILSRAEGRRRVEDVLTLLEHPEIRPESPVVGLSPAAQQLVEIARALLLDVKVLILDEPTSSLSSEDADRLVRLVRRVRDAGTAVVWISHFLEEVRRIADRFTVLRDGLRAGGDVIDAFDPSRVIEMMVGRRLDELFPHVPHDIGEEVLRLEGLTTSASNSGADLRLRRGEILGLAGIVGAGRTELLRAIFALDPVRRGRVIVKGVEVRRATPGIRIEQGVGMVSEDRKQEGLALDLSLSDNLTWSRLGRYSRFGWLNLRRRRRVVLDWLDRLGVRCRDPEQSVGELSGGNQQKIAVGRLLHQEADVLLLDEPTRGVDVAGKAAVYRLIGDLAARGKAVLFVSSYLPELFGVCDRIAVMNRGRLGEARPVADWTPESIMAEMTATASKTAASALR